MRGSWRLVQGRAKAGHGMCQELTTVGNEDSGLVSFPTAHEVFNVLSYVCMASSHTCIYTRYASGFKLGMHKDYSTYEQPGYFSNRYTHRFRI
jgi:hypothetical protein